MAQRPVKEASRGEGAACPIEHRGYSLDSTFRHAPGGLARWSAAAEPCEALAKQGADAALPSPPAWAKAKAASPRRGESPPHSKCSAPSLHFLALRPLGPLRPALQAPDDAGGVKWIPILSIGHSSLVLLKSFGVDPPCVCSS